MTTTGSPTVTETKLRASRVRTGTSDQRSTMAPRIAQCGRSLAT
jgi:hypothetical protein